MRRFNRRFDLTIEQIVLEDLKSGYEFSIPERQALDRLARDFVTTVLYSGESTTSHASIGNGFSLDLVEPFIEDTLPRNDDTQQPIETASNVPEQENTNQNQFRNEAENDGEEIDIRKQGPENLHHIVDQDLSVDEELIEDTHITSYGGMVDADVDKNIGGNTHKDVLRDKDVMTIGESLSESNDEMEGEIES